MNRYFLRIAFNGTLYHGWQMQENAHTVQAEVEKALSIQLRHEVSCTGCGRTDTGVHASTFYLHFDTEKTIINHRQFLFKLNHSLPPAIASYELIPVKDTSHARFDAIERTYTYYISRLKDPFSSETSYYVYGDLDIDAMNLAASFIRSHTDFAGFSKAPILDNSTCRIFEAFWRSEESMLIFTVTANRFLRNMVRAMVGTMLEIGRKRLTPEDVHSILQSRQRAKAGFSAPAQGLVLSEVKYKEGVLR